MALDRDSLREVQQPLKNQYREDPDSAVVTLRAAAELGAGVSCSVQTGRALVQAGLHPAAGGTGTQACSGDMLLQALAACVGVTLTAVALSMEIPIESGTVDVEGDLNFSGTLGVDKSTPVGFTDIQVIFDLKTTATEAQVADLIRLTERYCVVFQTLANPAHLSAVVRKKT